MKSVETDFQLCFRSWHNASKHLAERTHGVGGKGSSLQGLNIKYCVCDKLKPQADAGIKLQDCDHNTKRQQREKKNKDLIAVSQPEISLPVMISHFVLLLENVNTKSDKFFVLFGFFYCWIS